MVKSSVRTVVGLKWAKQCPRPRIIPKGRPRGVKAVGIRYENRVAEAVYRATNGSSSQGQWFEFEDANGRGYCQVDVLVKCDYNIYSDQHTVFVIECKLTEVEEAREKLIGLYIPVVKMALSNCEDVRGIVVTRHLTKESNLGLVCESLGAAMMSSMHVIPTLHWLAKGPNI